MKGCRNGVGIVFNTKLTLSCATRVGVNLYVYYTSITPVSVYWVCLRLHGQLVVAAVWNWRRAEGNRVSTHFSSWPSYLYSMLELLELAVL